MTACSVIQSHALKAFIGILFLTGFTISQTPTETPPLPGEPPTLTLPEVREMRLDNGLTVVVVERRGLPLVTASMLVKKGASSESRKKAGVASMTVEMLSKGTAGRNATQIAEQIEFLGASLNANAGWNGSSVTVNVTKDKLGRALSIISDILLYPEFPQKEITLLKKQALDELSVRLKQPSTLMNFVADTYTYGEHPNDGTPRTVKGITRADLVDFHTRNYSPKNSVLMFAGDIPADKAFRFAKLFFGGWEGGSPAKAMETAKENSLAMRPATIKRILVVDLPDSGQAAVGFVNKLSTGRTSNKSEYFAATVLNSVLGGGYSARLNQEIRLKRGLSYGARSGFSWRKNSSNFIAVAQTKNESAGEVAELIKIEIDKLIGQSISSEEMTPRKAVVTGGFGRSLQTNNGLVGELNGLYAYGLSAEELNTFTEGVKRSDAGSVRSFAENYLSGGDIIIVGDAKMFLDDLKKRFEDKTVTVIGADKINLDSSTLK